MRSTLSACAAAVGLAALTFPAGASAAQKLYGLTRANELVTFQSDNATHRQARVALSGVAAGEQIVGIDVRPANGALVGVSTASRLYSIDPATGVATAIGMGPFATRIAGTVYGFDFNPTVDRIRLVSDAEQNLRLHPDSGVVAATDKPLAYAAGDPAAGSDPYVAGAAYTNSVMGATATQLFDLDLGRDALVLQDPPNDGALKTVGSLGVDARGPAGFDIGTGNAAFAALTVSGSALTGLYSIDLATGKATLLADRVAGRRLRGLAAAGDVPDDKRAPRLRASARVRGGAITLTVRCDEACTFSARVRGGDSADGRIEETAGSLRVRIRGSAGARVSVRATDGAGNRSTATAPVR